MCRFDKKNGNEDIDKSNSLLRIIKEDKIMWLNLLNLGIKTGAKIYQNKQRTKQLMSDAQMHHLSKWRKAEIEYKAKVIESNFMIMVGKTNLSQDLIKMKFFYWLV